MKFFIKKIYIIFFLLIALLTVTKVFAKDSKIQYTRENIANYFLGIISVNQDYNNEAFKYLNKVQSIKDKHSHFNLEFIRTLVLLEKFKQAFSFSKSVWSEDELFFESDLLLGLNYFIEKDSDYFLVLTGAIPLHILIVGMGFVRQAMAVSFFLIAIKYLTANKNIKSLGFFLKDSKILVIDFL